MFEIKLCAQQTMEDDFSLIDDEEGSISSIVSEVNITRELELFRQQWYDEIHGQAERSSDVDTRSKVHQLVVSSEPSDEDQARYLFLQGVTAEHAGRLYDAIQYYRKAVQLVPDIEFKIDEFRPVRRVRTREESESSACLSESGEIEDEITDLIQHFQRVQCLENKGCICHAATENKAMHIGQLPVEVIQYILKWVISSDLDIYSLDQLSCVCRGLYLCARDDELWRLVCLRIWGINCGTADKYGSYRDMYLQRPHLRFNGCYISKCVYYRAGEKSLDCYYRPYHRVEYYRYVRFFPEGKVLMLTTPDNPYVVLPLLHSRGTALQGLLSGYYKLTGDRVTLVLQKVRPAVEYQPMYRYKRTRNVYSSEQTFDAEFVVTPVRNRAHWQIVWTHYAIRTCNRATREENIAEFELSNNNYPPLLFSHVKSFSAVSSAPLR